MTLNPPPIYGVNEAQRENYWQQIFNTNAIVYSFCDFIDQRMIGYKSEFHNTCNKNALILKRKTPTSYKY